ncbi:MAG: glycosyltransferase family 9 protein [Patescibacteria group bacterium]|nr:glycosyltransferase family 9 protein [Patescibacteria group bacterium]
MGVHEHSGWREVKNLLCLRLDSLGDVLMTTPAIHALRQGLPEAKITLLTSPSGLSAVEYNPDLDGIWAYQAPWIKWPNVVEDPNRELQLIEELRNHHFDAAVIFTVYSQSPLPAALMCYLGDIPKRLAYCHENPYLLLTDWVKDKEPKEFVMHEVQRQLNLVSSIGFGTQDVGLVFEVQEEFKKSARQKLSRLKLDLKKPWVVIHPGCTAPSRTYPWEKYAQVADGLIDRFGWQVVFTGKKDEDGLVNKIQSQMQNKSFSLSGKLNIQELAEVLRLTQLYIGNNTGPSHLAAAMKTPTVVLYALINNQHTPWGNDSKILNHEVPCKNCLKSLCPLGHNDCLQKVDPEEVINAAEALAND